jgi:hypothetical protein
VIIVIGSLIEQASPLFTHLGNPHLVGLITSMCVLGMLVLFIWMMGRRREERK